MSRAVTRGTQFEVGAGANIAKQSVRPPPMVLMDCDAVHSALARTRAKPASNDGGCHVETSDVGRPDPADGDRGCSHAADATRHRRRDGHAATGLFPTAH